MKTASWFLTLLLAGVLAYSFAQVPPSDSLRSLHIASRYQDRSEMETGISSRTGAIAADYRSTDLLAVAALFSTASLCLLLFSDKQPWEGALPASLLVFLGALLTLGMGFLCFVHGGNFLDYEWLAAWVGPLHARVNGALALFGGTLLSFGGLLMLALHRWRAPGGSGGR